MEWVKITHPFHPLYGKHFKLLKKRKVSGRDTLILQGTSSATFAVDSEWTDKDTPDIYECSNTSHLILSCHKLLELAELVDKINKMGLTNDND